MQTTMATSRAGHTSGCTILPATINITTARDQRPAAELAAQPLAGCVLQLRVEVPGLPAHLADPAYRA